MQLIALFCEDPDVAEALTQVEQPPYHLHLVALEQPLAAALTALSALDFAGALVLGESLQRQAFAQVQRSSLDAQNSEAVDAVTVTPLGLVGEYTLGRALARALLADAWDLRGARVVLLGAGAEATVLAKELASLGASHVTVLAQDRPAAEKALPPLAATVTTQARALSEPLAGSYVEQADVLVRTNPDLKVDKTLLGPHLSVIDLSPAPLSPLRKTAFGVGAKSLGLRDIQAYQAALALSHVLGSTVEVDAFLTLLHGQVQ